MNDPVTWTYEVTNPGNLPLADVVVTDDQGVMPVFQGGDTNGDDLLDPEEIWLYEATGTAELGQYANMGTVTAPHPVEVEAELTDDDPSHYFGYIVEVDIEKFTNGEDADEPTGPPIPVGDPVTWTYEVTNPGNLPAADVVVTDDQGVTPVFQSGDTNGDDLLDPSETWLYEATGTAEVGQYANVGAVTATDPVEGETELTDSDPSHYIGFDAGTATLGDTVWLDENTNGVQDEGEVGIEGVRVTVASTSEAFALMSAVLRPPTYL